MCGLANELGVTLGTNDISTCYRVGKPQGDKIRQRVVGITSRRKRDAIYDRRRKLKDIAKYSNKVYVNEDLTRLRHAVLMTAKRAPTVKGVSTRQGNIVCKMENDEYVVLRSPDDLFDIGIDNVQYTDYKLNLI